MAHFAELDDNNKVIQSVVINNNELMVNGIETESAGIAFCQSLFGGRWIQTSYNGSIRKNFAGNGMFYDESRDAFIAPQPNCHPSEISLDEQTCKWLCADPAHLIESVTPTA
jgi:hypothetical protein